MRIYPKNTDIYPLKYFISGFLSARYPQIKYSNYDSLEKEIMVFKIFDISY